MPTTISKVGNRNSSGLPHQSPTVAPDNVSVESSVRNLNQTEYTNVMTRKTRNKQVRDGAAVGNASVVDACSMKTHNDIIKRDSDKCGYCEACRIEYDVLSVHLQTKEHLAFKNNGENYIQVDKLINDGANVESFLKATTGRTHKPALANQSPTNLNAKSLTNGNHAVKESENGRAVSKMSADDDADVINDDCDCGNVNGNGELVQMNGIAKMSNGIGDDDVSPNVSPRGKLPKYSPPMTRRSQNKSGNSKSSSPAKTLKPEQADAECEANEVTSPRARRENAKRINCINSKDFDDKTTETQTPKTMEHVASDDSPQMRRLIRTFPRYKVSTVASKDTDDGTAAAMHPPTVSSTVSADCEHGQSTSKRMTQHEHRDPASGIIVKFKRVRESELSKLTFEADNFMFPKQRDELPTDDDRPSTSEQCPDVSSDILSSDVDEPSAASPPKQTADEPSDLFTSSGRRKKRRTQYDSFKAEQRTTGVTASESVRKRKFRESLVRPRLSITKAVEESPTAEAAATTVATDAQQSSKGTRRNVKRGKGGRAKKAAPTPRAKRAAKGGAAAATDGPNEAEDGTRDNSYNGGSILSTDFFKTFEFSFERVPANEPWFLAFQRQDECRERIFEYWGNTGNCEPAHSVANLIWASSLAAYRKLPFELGPLPPLQSDCCILSKLAAMKAARQQKSRRGRNAKAKAARIASETDEQNEAGNSQAPDEAAPLMTTITRSSNKEAGDGAHSRKPSLPGGDSVARKSRTSSLAKLLMNESALNNLASSIPPKKRVLLDAFGQPRKSPREHASTLAILSSLVQQKRKRLKELNGGISPEKMPNYSAALGTSNDATDTEELEDDDFCDNDSKNVYDVDDQHSRSSMRKSSTNTPQPTKDAEITTDSCEKLFFLRKGKRRQTASTSSNNDTVDAKAEEAAEPEAEQAVKAPKMPVDDYVDPNKVAKKIDDLLNSCYSETGNEFGDIELPAEGSVDAADLILVNTPKDFVEILMSVKEGPLTYRSFVNVNKKTGLSSFTQRGKKRHINKTGWPSLPKRRVTIKKEKVDEICIDDAHAHSNTEDEENHSNAEEQCSGRNRFHVNRNGRTDGDCIDISSQLMGDEFFIQSRQKLKTPSSIKGEHFDEPDEGHEADDDDEDGADDDDDDYNNDDLDECETFCNDNDNAVSNLFASSSEKAENSDIFTVSSDSLDTTDLPDTKSGAKLVEPGTPSVQDEDESLNETDDESSSDATTIADIKKSLSPLAAKPMQKMETRATNERSPITKDKINKLSLQPIVCVRKISEKDLYRRTYSKSTSPQKSAKQSPIKHPSIDSQSLNQDLSTYRRNSSSPKAKISPRKLRKPRGRWYRER